MKKRWIYLIPIVAFVLYLSIYGVGVTIQNELLSIRKRIDGGYSLQIEVKKRYWKLVTSEGVFPSSQQVHVVELVGEGEDWSYRNQSGYYYAISDVESSQSQWDLGYVWLSADKKYIFLNLFWVNAPDGLVSSDINGRYNTYEN